MIRSQFIASVLAVFVLAPVFSGENENGRYAGAIVCKSCHGPGQDRDPFTVWSVSKHSRTWVQLGTGYVEMIDPDARGLVPEGFGGSIQKEANRLGVDENCMLCHTTAEGTPEALKNESFHIEDGVQCEACHGPGRAHVLWMEEFGRDVLRQETAHMRVGTIDDCEKTCHRPKPTHEPFIGTHFDVEKAWSKIKH